MYEIDKIKELAKEQGKSMAFLCTKLNVTKTYFADIAIYFDNAFTYRKAKKGIFRYGNPFEKMVRFRRKPEQTGQAAENIFRSRRRLHTRHGRPERADRRIYI